MNYRHAFHAGNFADVFKHIVLIALIQSFKKKDKAVCYIDTHAGAGFYDLLSLDAKKNNESTNGIKKLFREKEAPILIQDYLQCIQTINDRLSHSTIASLRYYPGSPIIMRHFLRFNDRMILTELHPDEFNTLKNHFKHDPKVTLQLADGYQNLKACLPPKERRGLILIDPPYERPNELTYLSSILPLALKRFETGVYAIWYPIKDRPTIDRFHRTLKETIKQPILIAELSLYPAESPAFLNGSGMAIINPPWQLDRELNDTLPWLWKTLSPHRQGNYQVTLL